MSAAGKGKAPAIVADADDDLDDLDDVLDQFKAAPMQGHASSNATTSQQGRGGNSDGDGVADNDDDNDDDFEAIFAAELAKEMEKMMSGLKPSNDNVAGSTGSQSTKEKAASSSPTLNDNEKQLQEAFEKMLSNMGADGEGLLGDDLDLEQLSKLMNGLGAGAATPPGTSSASSSSKPTGSSIPNKKPQSFQDTIAATMSKLAESDAQNKARASGASGKGSEQDQLAALMAQMEALGGAGLGGEGGEDGDLPGMLDGLMDQLMSKELLYEPISELRTKYPEYLASSEAASLSADEKSRYERQGAIVRKIATIFEDPKYSDDNKEMRANVAELMQQMQDCGAPPKHLLGELGPAMGLNADGTPNLDPENCTIS